MKFNGANTTWSYLFSESFPSTGFLMKSEYTNEFKKLDVTENHKELFLNLKHECNEIRRLCRIKLGLEKQIDFEFKI
jgi:hypothetical protein